MNQELVKAFKNDKFGNVRVVLIGENQEPYFVGKDVAECLGYSNTKDAINTHVDDEDKRVIQRSEITTLEIPNRGLTVINESGLYSLILSSKLPQAKEFKRWVTSEVLPSIRKTGSYTAPNKDVSKALAEFRGQVATLVNDIFDKKMEDVREYYKINSKSKVDISTYIKKRLGITKLILSVIIQQ